MNRDERPQDPFAGIDPDESKLSTTAGKASEQFKDVASAGDVENFPAWLELELEKLEALYQGFSTRNSRRSFFGR